MEINQKTTEEYYIVFTESKHNNWMIKMLTAPFQHVYAIKKSSGKAFWIIIEPLISYTSVNIIPVDEKPHIRLLVKDSDKVIKVRANIGENERWTFCVINCVEIVKSLIGIRAFWVWTPRQLYKYLRGGYNG